MIRLLSRRLAPCRWLLQMLEPVSEYKMQPEPHMADTKVEAEAMSERLEPSRQTATLGSSRCSSW